MNQQAIEFEAIRNRRIADNQRRLQELGLPSLAKNVRAPASDAAAAQRKPRAPRQAAAPSRRSDRARQSVNYAEDPFAGTRLARTGGGGRGPSRILTEEEMKEILSQVRYMERVIWRVQGNLGTDTILSLPQHGAPAEGTHDSGLGRRVVVRFTSPIARDFAATCIECLCLLDFLGT